MKLRFKRWGLVLIVILLGEVAVSHLLLRPKQKELSEVKQKHAGLETKLSKVNQKIEKQTEQLQQLQQELTSPITEARIELSDGLEVPTFLEYISRLVQSLEIQYISIQLNPEKAGSLQTSYNIKVNSEYRKIVRLVDNLESQLNLGVENLKIKAGEDNPYLHEASFDLSFLKMAEEQGLPADPEKLEAVLKLAQVFTKKSVKKDPFYHRIISKKGRKRFVAKSKVDLVLRGIMEVMGKKVALINQHILHEGDQIKGYRLVKIGQNKVNLRRRKRKYVLNLRGLFSLKDAELEKGKT